MSTYMYLSLDIFDISSEVLLVIRADASERGLTTHRILFFLRA
jgi:hypothetical protein